MFGSMFDLMAGTVGNFDGFSASKKIRHMTWALNFIRSRLVFVPAIAWYLLFTQCPNMPTEMKPAIDVWILPHVEFLMLGFFPHRSLSSRPHIVLDVLAAAVYTLHAALPVLFISFLLLSGRRRKIYRFGFCFGLISFISVVTHVFWPTAPPWFYDRHGLMEADYGFMGDAAGLERIDVLTGTRFYSTAYAKSPIVFGSFPSLHASWPLLIALQVPPEMRRLRRLVFWYTYVVWWAALYLRHHYLLDILGAVVYVVVIHWISSSQRLINWVSPA